METFSVLLVICAGNSPVPGEFPAQRPATRSFDVFFELRPNKSRVNNGEAGDLRRQKNWKLMTGAVWKETKAIDSQKSGWSMKIDEK